jgi:hypothetical protein
MSDPNRNECSYSEKPNDSDTIYRQDALEALRTCYEIERIDYTNGNEYINYEQAVHEIEQAPAAQPNYQEVLGWLLAYHTMSFDLHGRYLPHEVISWLINDFTKEFIAERGQNG